MFGAFGHVLQLVLDAEFLAAAEFDVGAAARHVRRDRHRAGATACATICYRFAKRALRMPGGTPFRDRRTGARDFLIDTVPTSTG